MLRLKMKALVVLYSRRLRGAAGAAILRAAAEPRAEHGAGRSGWREVTPRLPP